MKRALLLALLLAAPLAQAQFLNQDIIRQAGVDAATGNIRLNNVDFGDNAGEPARPAPSAAEIAAEIRAQEADERWRRQAAAQDERRRRVNQAVERAYKAEFKK
ncbi:hypothetical protein QPK31_17035 [Massilia sp. YIM B02769]|uniref:hypothetical protein n=1 Tax=Massilia sp. YIM B02769 TaxID=3050129 RepID=UPI0025B6A004|nr:hypothetical protein [Massilia sp. YIM B02769]MDN4059924.1 hypothetical protein [Massilia sp. YIM B02769]